MWVSRCGSIISIGIGVDVGTSARLRANVDWLAQLPEHSVESDSYIQLIGNRES